MISQSSIKSVVRIEEELRVMITPERQDAIDYYSVDIRSQSVRKTALMWLVESWLEIDQVNFAWGVVFPFIMHDAKHFSVPFNTLKMTTWLLFSTLIFKTLHAMLLQKWIAVKQYCIIIYTRVWIMKPCVNALITFMIVCHTRKLTQLKHIHVHT